MTFGDLFYFLCLSFFSICCTTLGLDRTFVLDVSVYQQHVFVSIDFTN